MDRIRLSSIKAIRDSKKDAEEQIKRNYSLEDENQALYAEGLKQREILDRTDELEEKQKKVKYFDKLQRRLSSKKGE